MSENPRDALSEPVFDALTILISGDELQARRVLDRALLTVSGGSAAEWQVRAVHSSRPGAFDLLPPPWQSLTVQQAFDLKYALEEQAEVASAEALFVTNSDNEPEPPESPGLEGFGSDWFAALLPSEQNSLWSLDLIRAGDAWQLSRGDGILVAHPDSGYIPHPSLDDDRIRHDLEHDFFDGDADARNPDDRGGNHGLSTGGVIMSGGAPLPDGRFVRGVAPGVQLVPMRITRKGPPVFLMRSGPRMVRDAVYHAIDSGCHVISMSMGGIGDDSLHWALREAVRRNLLVLAAAGNYVRIVVWPALYPEVIAVAACDVDGRPWEHSSQGPAVDVTAPGNNIWRAYIDENGAQSVKPSNGTSYAVATTAGVAALWLAHHGRDKLLARYEGIPLQNVFRHVLRASADPLPPGTGDGFGAGLVNAVRLLSWPLPDPVTIALGGLESTEEELPGLGAESGGVDGIAAVFAQTPDGEVRRQLAVMTAAPESALDETLSGVSDELLFHIVTNPTLRETMAAGGEGLEALPGEPDVTLHAALREVPGLSSTLKARIER